MIVERGQTLSHYRLIEKIGEGGMGVVYRAHDERLDRDVAVKVLPAGTLADEVTRKRFRKEALVLSKLNHPNIETVHDFDTQEGVDFLVMEYIPGVTLNEKLAKKALPEKEIVKLGVQLAEGLAAAHDQGVIHRDLKPGNLRVTPDGRLKILDFGLAKMLRPITDTATTQSLTEKKAMAGTLPYMAPEQLRGEKMDIRTDIYSLGVVLYEMATGQRPFREELATNLTDSILHQAPVTPRAVSPKVSPDLERIILKCLDKAPENRYQSAKELGVDLRRLGAPEPVSAELSSTWPSRAMKAVMIGAFLTVVGFFAWQRIRIFEPHNSGKVMLAVLPFDNLSGDPEQEFFSDGMTEEMIAQLGRLQPQKLGVIARTSVMLFKDTKKPIDQIGQELGVDYLLEGSVRRASDQVRITVQLIQVSDQTHLWAESFVRDLEDVFAIQREVADRVASSLRVELLPVQEAGSVSVSSTNPKAHEAYLKGRYYWNKRTEVGFRKAIEYFQQAIDEDPAYALAYTGLADAYKTMAVYGVLPPKEASARAKAAVLKALELDDTLAEAHTSLALLLQHDLDWAAAEREYKRAHALNPNYATAHQWYAWYLVAMGRFEGALAQIHLAQTLDPLSDLIRTSVGAILYFARRYDQAFEHSRRTLEMAPKFFVAHRLLAMTYVEKEMFKEAITAYQRAITLSEGSTLFLADLGHAYARAGQRDEARKILDELTEQGKRNYVSPVSLALIYTGLGKKDEAFAWLERGYEERDEWIPYLKIEPRLDPLRSDPRFQDLLRRMNFPE